MLNRHILHNPKLPHVKPFVQTQSNRTIQTAKPFPEIILKNRITDNQTD